MASNYLKLNDLKVEDMGKELKESKWYKNSFWKSVIGEKLRDNSRILERNLAENSIPLRKNTQKITEHWKKNLWKISKPFRYYNKSSKILEHWKKFTEN